MILPRILRTPLSWFFTRRHHHHDCPGCGKRESCWCSDHEWRWAFCLPCIVADTPYQPERFQSQSEKT